MRLGEVCQVLSGNAWKSEGFSDDTDGVPVIRIQNVTDGHSSFVYWTGEYDSKFVIKDGDLLLSMSGNVKLCQWSRGQGLLNQRVVKLVPNERLQDRFFYWAVQRVISKIESLAKKAVIANVSVSDLREFEIPLPPLEEQKRIAAILDKADAIRKKRQQAIELADQFLKSVFLDMFGDAERLWQVVNLEDIAAAKKGSIRTGPFGSQLLHSEFTDSGIAVLGIDNAVNNEFRWAKPRYISEEKYESLKRYTVSPKDLIITIMGTCGRCAIVPEDVPAAINTKHLCCITLNLDLCVPEFLHAYFLMHPLALNYLRRESKGAVMDGLNMGIIKEMPVHLPPIEMQQRFAGIVDSVSEVGKSFDLHGGQTDVLFKSLVQESLQ